jgi:hypothetical protein
MVSSQHFDDFFLELFIVDAFVGLTFIKLDGQNVLILFLVFLPVSICSRSLSNFRSNYEYVLLHKQK